MDSFMLTCSFLPDLLNCIANTSSINNACQQALKRRCPPVDPKFVIFNTSQDFWGDGLCDPEENCHQVPSDCGFCAGRPFFFQGCVQPHTLALTFDDGPIPISLKVLKQLRRRGLPATFYMVGKNVLSNPDIVRSIIKDGHMVAGHSWEHGNLTDMSYPLQVREEIYKGFDALFNVTGKQYRHFRPPYGALDRFDILKNSKLSVDFWTFETFDWQWYSRSRVAVQGKKAQMEYFRHKILDIIESNIRPTHLADYGHIVLQHDINSGTTSEIGPILDKLMELRDRFGFRFVRMDECTGIPETF